jgi:hypothetical protein
MFLWAATMDLSWSTTARSLVFLRISFLLCECLQSFDVIVQHLSHVFLIEVASDQVFKHVVLFFVIFVHVVSGINLPNRDKRVHTHTDLVVLGLHLPGEGLDLRTLFVRPAGSI